MSDNCLQIGANRQNMAAMPRHKGGEGRADEKGSRRMKTRWMKSVIEASRQDMPALPFGRGRRFPAGAARRRMTFLKSA